MSKLLSFTEPSSQYVISLRAFNNIGEGRQILETAFTRYEAGELKVVLCECLVLSCWLSAVEEAPTPMTPPVGLRAQVLSSSTIVLTWTDTTLGRNQRVSDTRYYTVRYSSTSSRKHRLVNTTNLNIHIRDLKPSTEYEFGVKVIKGRRQSTWSLSAFNKTFESGTVYFLYSLFIIILKFMFFSTVHCSSGRHPHWRTWTTNQCSVELAATTVAQWSNYWSVFCLP
jgi:hypothetical protein